MPEIGEKVSVIANNPFARFVTRGIVDRVYGLDQELPGGARAFTVRTLDCVLLDDTGRCTLWSFTPDFIEGIGWARGWDGEAVDALRAAMALA